MAWKAKLAMNGKVLHRNPIRVGWGRPVPSKVLWIGGLGPEVTTNLLQRECAKFGSIYNIKYVNRINLFANKFEYNLRL